MNRNKHIQFKNKSLQLHCFHTVRWVVLSLVLFIFGCNSVLKEETIYEDGGNLLTTMRVEQGDFIAKAISRARIATTFPIHEFEKEVDVANDYLWTLTTPIDHLPEYQSQALLLQSIYNLALEETEANMDKNGMFNSSGSKSPLTTIDISMSILLGLAITHPDASRKALVDRVSNGLILQDAELGGGWPANVDRAAWIVAAWELYLINGNENWLRTAYNVSSRTIDQDLAVVYDVEHNLFRGTPPYTHMLEGVYPEWMSLADITETYALSVNSLYYQALQCLTKMSLKLNTGKHARYRILAKDLKDSINEKFWNDAYGYYSSMLYNNAQVQDPRSATLANAWAIIFDIADAERSHEIAHKLPVNSLGAPRYYPHQKDIEAPANNTIWLVHQAFWNKAIKKTQNHKAYPHGLFSLIRPTAMNMTHRDYVSAENGKPVDYGHNRTQSLSAVSTTIGTLLQQIFGIEYTEEGILLNPFVPKSLNGEHRILGLRYREAILNLKLRGYGDQVYAIFIGQRPLTKALIPASLEGVYDITVVMTTVEDVTDLGLDDSDLVVDSTTYEKIDPLDILNERLMSGDFNLVPHAYMPRTPSFLAFENQSVVWNVLDQNDIYHLFRNGKKVTTTQRPRHLIDPHKYSAYQLQINNDEGLYSFLGKPLIEKARGIESTIEAEDLTNATAPMSEVFGYSGQGYLKLEEVSNADLRLTMNLPKKTTYLIRFKYSNGNKVNAVQGAASYRAIYLNDFRYESVVMPSNLNGNWNEWMYSNPINITLPAGRSTLSLKLEPNADKNRASKNPIYLDHIQLININE